MKPFTTARGRVATLAVAALAAGTAVFTPAAASAAAANAISRVEITAVTPTTLSYTVTWANATATKGHCFMVYTGGAPGSYTWTASGSATQGTSPAAATGVLTNGVDGVELTAGAFNTLAVVDAATGSGTAATCPSSATSPRASASYFIPEETPSAPLNLTSTPGDSQVTLNWEWPVSDGTEVITSFSATDGAGHGCDVSADAVDPYTCTVTGLTNGVEYTFVVTAYNANGAGRDSNPASATPTGLPGAPRMLEWTPGDAQVELSWQIPTSNGGLDIDYYTVTASPGGATCTATAPAVTCTVTGLTNGTYYSFDITAHNANGNGPAATASNVMPVGTPDAPTDVSANPGDGQVTVSWTAPTNTGGVSLVGYRVVAQPGGFECWADAPDTSCTIDGLTNGVEYTFVVYAGNGTNTSATSADAKATPSKPVTVPDAPTDVTATGGNSQATVSWTAPGYDGGADIESYTVTSSPGGQTCTVVAPGTSCTVLGLTNGKSYTFTVVATNRIGDSLPSGASNSVSVASSDFQVIAGNSTLWIGGCTTFYVVNGPANKTVALRIGGQVVSVATDGNGAGSYYWCADPSTGNKVLSGKNLLVRASYKVKGHVINSTATTIYVPKLTMRAKFRTNRSLQAIGRSIAPGSEVVFTVTPAGGSAVTMCTITVDASGLATCTGTAGAIGDYLLTMTVDGVLMGGNSFTVTK